VSQNLTDCQDNTGEVTLREKKRQTRKKGGQTDARRQGQEKERIKDGRIILSIIASQQSVHKI